MGKLSIIPGRDTRDYARRTSKEEEEASRRAAAAAAVVAGGAVSRSSAASSAIADSAAADRRLHAAGAVDYDHPRRSDDTSSQGGTGGGCAGRRSACDRPGIANRTDLLTDVIVGFPGDSPARRRCRVDDVPPVATRLRRNTWHADRPEDESCVVEAPSVGARRSDAADSRDAVDEAEQQRVLDASGALGTRRWDARIAGDERRRTCCATDVASPPQQQARRPRDRGAGPAANSGRPVVERRRSRRSATSAAARGRSVGAPDVPETDRILRSTVDGIAIANAAREGASGRKFAPKGAVNNERVGANGTSPVSVFEETRRQPTDDVDAERVVGSLDDDSSNGAPSEVVPRPARLIEIGIADSSCATRCLAGQAADGTRSLGKTIARLVPDESPARPRTKTDTCWRSPAARLGFVVRTLLLGLLAKSLLCDAVLGAPSSASIDLVDGSSVVYEDEKEPAVKPGSDLREGELEIIRRSIVQGLGLQRIPDASKVSLGHLHKLLQGS